MFVLVASEPGTASKEEGGGLISRVCQSRAPELVGDEVSDIPREENHNNTALITYLNKAPVPTYIHQKLVEDPRFDRFDEEVGHSMRFIPPTRLL